MFRRGHETIRRERRSGQDKPKIDMRFDAYGRYRLEVVRKDGSWVVYHLGEGKRNLNGWMTPGGAAPPREFVDVANPDGLHVQDHAGR